MIARIFLASLLVFVASLFPFSAIASSSADEALEDIRSSYLDEKGFVIQGDKDAGDALNRLGHLYSLLALLGYDQDLNGNDLDDGFKNSLSAVTVEPGYYRRHWDDTKWYWNEKTTSRDQYAPIIVASSLLDIKEIQEDIFSFLVNNKLRFPNTVPNGERGVGKNKEPDVITPGIASLFLRARGSIQGIAPYDKKNENGEYIYGMEDLDCESLYSVRYRSIQNVGVGADGGSDDVTTTLILLHSLNKMPNKTIRRAVYEYMNGDQKPDERISYYFREATKSPPFGPIFSEALEKYFEPIVKNYNDDWTSADEERCGDKMSSMVGDVVNQVFGQKKICKEPFPIKHVQNVENVEFYFGEDNLKLKSKINITCKTKQNNVVVKDEVKGEIPFEIEVDPSSCHVKKALARNIKLRVSIFTLDIPEWDFRNEAQKEVSVACNLGEPLP